MGHTNKFDKILGCNMLFEKVSEQKACALLEYTHIGSQPLVSQRKTWILAIASTTINL